MNTFNASLPNGALDALTVDAIVQENYVETATITSHPVEAGPNISDNTTPEPTELQLLVVVSNTPMFPTPADSPTDAEDAYQKLVSWKNAGALLDFTLTVGTFESMAIKAINVQRDAKTGGQPGSTGGLRITLHLKQIIVVYNTLTAITPSNKINVPAPVKQGTVPTTTPNTDLANGFTDTGTQILKVLPPGLVP